MERFPDWRDRLTRLLEARSTSPFAWGLRDCTTLAADAVLAMTGQDLLAPWRGTYRSAREACRLLSRADAETVADLADRVACEAGLVRAAPPATGGDIVTVETVIFGSREAALGVVTPSGDAVACQGIDGIVLRGPADILRAWRL